MNAKLGELFILMVCLLGLTWSHAQTLPKVMPPTDDQVLSILQKRIDKNAARGIAVVLVDPDGSVRFLSKGQSGNPARPQIDADTLFEIGSITKVFTSTLLAQIAAQGALGLDTRLAEVMGTKPAWANPGVGAVTLRQLATHTSGLPRLPQDANFLWGMVRSLRNPYANYSEADMWNYVRQLPLEVQLDRPVAYSNLGVGLLGQVLASSEKMSYIDLVNARILAPLGMTATGISLSTDRAPFMAQGHNVSLLPVPLWDLPSMPGAGALRSSTRDMARFLQAHMQGTLAGVSATHPAQVRIDDTQSVALGWFIEQRHGEEIHWHNGGTGGFRTFAGFNLKSGKGVVVLSNVSQGVDDIGLHLLNQKFPIKDDPRSVNLTAIVISIVFCVSLLLHPLVMPGASLGQLPATGMRGRLLRWHQSAILRSKSELFWNLLEMLVVSIFAYHFVAWEWIGTQGRLTFFAIIGLLVLTMVWQSRKLPWRATERAGNRWLRIIGRSFSLLMLAIAVWNLAP
jgi:CubicO group peptidase (beta-lactamase class C family)